MYFYKILTEPREKSHTDLTDLTENETGAGFRGYGGTEVRGCENTIVP